MTTKQPVQNKKPTEIRMQIHTGMLESLGINMYTSIGKSLVEFVANGFDAESKAVNVYMPFADIETARAELRAKAKKEHEEGLREDFKNIYEALPDHLEIVIKDDGHGMTVQEVENKFLVVNRNRRKTQGPKSENGLRTVMGRKGLGKLAGFGVAEQVVIRTKRKGETYATTFIMDFNEIKKYESVGDVKFDPTYEEGLPADDSGTTITLKRLRCDSLKNSEDNIESVLAKNFFITGGDFQVFMNDSLIADPNVEYEFIYPADNERIHNGFAEANVKVHEGFEYPILYQIKFRARGVSSEGIIRGSLPAHLRGARVYCNQRLAAGPTLFNLPTGMHNFYAQDYMECIVHADVLDQQETDLIGTNRSALKTDNDVVDAFVDTITGLMKAAIYQHSKFKEAIVDEQLEKDPVSKVIIAAVAQVPKKNREPAMKILKTLAVNEGIHSPVYKEIAPHIVQAINSSEVLSQLIKSGINPKDLQTIIEQLTELSSIERSDALKLYKARRNGISGLQKLQEDSHKGGRQDQYEDELQRHLKDNPWLIKPEYNTYLTSDNNMGEVARKLNAALAIDDQANEKDGGFDKRRPDLVFVLIEPGMSSIAVVELKSPNIPLDNDHLSQLESYMLDVEAMISADYNREVKVTGHLIGNLPKPDTKAKDAKLLLKKMETAGPSTMWEVITIPQILQRAHNVHQAFIDTLEAEEEED